MSELITPRNFLLALSCAAVCALAGFLSARLFPPTGFGTASIGIEEGSLSPSRLNAIALDIDAMLASNGLPSRVTAANSQIAIMVPPVSNSPTELRSILQKVLKQVPEIAEPRDGSRSEVTRLTNGIAKIREAEENVKTVGELGRATPTTLRDFDFQGYASAVIRLNNENDRLTAKLAALEPELQQVRWQEPSITLRTESMTAWKMAILGALFGFLVFVVFTFVSMNGKGAVSKQTTGDRS